MTTDPTDPAEEHWPLLPANGAGRSAGAAGAVCGRPDQSGGRSGDGRVTHRVAPRDRLKGCPAHPAGVAGKTRRLVRARIDRRGHRAGRAAARRPSPGFRSRAPPARQQFVHVQQQAAEEFEAGLRLAKRTLEETGWEAEAYFDGNKQIAPKQLEEFTIQVDAWRTTAAEEHDKARKLLRRWKQQPPEVVIDPETLSTRPATTTPVGCPSAWGQSRPNSIDSVRSPLRAWPPAGCSLGSIICAWD